MSRGKPDETGMCRAGNRHADGELPEHSAWEKVWDLHQWSDPGESRRFHSERWTS
jgi:hypothetical protein